MISYEKNKEQIDPLIESLKRKVKIRDLESDFTENDYIDEIIDAISAVNERRNFVITSEKIFDEKYSSLIVQLALFSMAKMGAEGETSHSENGISRGYSGASSYPESLLSEVKPLAKGV